MVSDTVENYYKTNFQLMYHYHFSLTEIENMYCYERLIYLGYLKLQKQNEQRANSQS